jgi:hypothetical protein
MQKAKQWRIVPSPLPSSGGPASGVGRAFFVVGALCELSLGLRRGTFNSVDFNIVYFYIVTNTYTHI